jgi:hypothetical protein
LAIGEIAGIGIPSIGEHRPRLSGSNKYKDNILNVIHSSREGEKGGIRLLDSN